MVLQFLPQLAGLMAGEVDIDAVLKQLDQVASATRDTFLFQSVDQAGCICLYCILYINKFTCFGIPILKFS